VIRRLESPPDRVVTDSYSCRCQPALYNREPAFVAVEEIIACITVLLNVCVEPLRDCSDASICSSGVYPVHLSNGQPVQVYCDVTTDGSRWLVSMVVFFI